MCWEADIKIMGFLGDKSLGDGLGMQWACGGHALNAAVEDESASVLGFGGLAGGLESAQGYTC